MRTDSTDGEVKEGEQHHEQAAGTTEAFDHSSLPYSPSAGEPATLGGVADIAADYQESVDHHGPQPVLTPVLEHYVSNTGAEGETIFATDKLAMPACSRRC